MSKTVSATLAATVLVLTMVTATAQAEPGLTLPEAPPGGAATRADVNGDGIADIVMSTSARLAFSGDTDLLPDDLGGSVAVVPGGATLPGAKPAFVNQANPNVGTGMAAEDRFGVALATGDFNGDALADVAIGNPHEKIGNKEKAGTVSVLYGQRTSPYLRLIPGALDRITQDTPDVPGSVEAGDTFGTSLATGDFNADGFADLAIGSPGEAIGTKVKAGAVLVLYGGSGGLSTRGLTNLNQGVGKLAGAAEADDLFGWSLAAGDVTGDGRDDLAIVSSGEAVAGKANAQGMVHLVHGSGTGLNVDTASSASVFDAATTGHWRSVVIGKFHGGAFADTIIYADQRSGAPMEAGALVSIRGGAGGLIAANNQVIDQNSPAMPGSSEARDFFGGSLAAGDLDGDTFTDLAVGAFSEDSGMGAVTLLRGGTAGLLSAPGFSFNENDPAINASGQSGEGFSYALRILDVTGDGRAELLISAPWEDFTLQTGTLFVVDVGVAGETYAVTGSRRLGRGELDLISHYGPGLPIAGGAVVLYDNVESPR